MKFYFKKSCFTNTVWVQAYVTFALVYRRKKIGKKHSTAKATKNIEYTCIAVAGCFFLCRIEFMVFWYLASLSRPLACQCNSKNMLLLVTVAQFSDSPVLSIEIEITFVKHICVDYANYFYISVQHKIYFRNVQLPIFFVPYSFLQTVNKFNSILWILFQRH